MKKNLLDFIFRIGFMINGIGIGMYLQTISNPKLNFPIMAIGLIMIFIAKNKLDKMEKDNKQ
jgi:Mn2+/Fe2+ NRAMP family transporter